MLNTTHRRARVRALAWMNVGGPLALAVPDCNCGIFQIQYLEMLFAMGYTPLCLTNRCCVLNAEYYLVHHPILPGWEHYGITQLNL